MSSGDNSEVGNSPINLRQLVSDRVYKLRKSFTPTKSTTKSSEDIIKALFDLGGVISGGAAVALIHNRPIKDVDFYFNNEQAYLDAIALTHANSKFDICWYFEQPHELHDIGFVMCNAYANRLEITEPAQQAIDSKVSSLFLDHIIWPQRTADRLLKYNKRYGIQFKKAEVLAFVAINTVENAADLMKISV